jgi:putative peptide zinc metalloprotease protein
MISNALISANPLLEVSDFDSDAGKPMVLCVVPGANAPVRLALPARYMELAEEFDGERTEDEAIDAFLMRYPESYKRDWVHRLIHQSLLPRGILVNAGQDPALVGVSNQSKRSFFFITLPILPPQVVDWIAQRLSFLFAKPLLFSGALLFLVSHLYVYGVLIQPRDVNFNQLNLSNILLIMLLSTLGTICHEFGHASAAARYGCKRMTIGWGIYIIYPVLWTNVSEAWKLPRRQRALVDIGGVYFESLFLLLMLALYLETGQALFLFAFIFIDLSIVMTLNPFLRMDGYWLISDLFGIVNLRQQQLDWIQEIGWKLFARGACPIRSNLTNRAKVALGIYSISGLVFFAYLLLVIVQFVILNIVSEYPTMIMQFAHDAIVGLPTINLVGKFFEIMWRTLILLAAAFALFSWSRSIATMLTRAALLRAQAQQPSV